MKCERYNEQEQTEFGAFLRKIFKENFILRDLNESAYNYYLSHEDTFNDYLRMLGYRLLINNVYGVVALQQDNEDTIKYSLRKDLSLINTAILAILIKLYYNAVTQNGEDYDEVYVEIKEIMTMADDWNIYRGKKPSITSVSESLNEMKKLNLIEVCGKEIKDDKTEIHLLPSLSMALNIETMKNAADEIMYEHKGE